MPGVSLTIRELKPLIVEAGTHGDESARDMVRIIARDQPAPATFAKAELVVDPETALGLAEGGNLSLVLSSGIVIDAISPNSLVEATEAAVLVAGSGFFGEVQIRVRDDTGAEVDTFVPTSYTPNALLVDLEIAEAGDYTVEAYNGIFTSNQVALTVAAA